MDFEAAAAEATDILEEHFDAHPPADEASLIVQYVAPAPNPTAPRWLQVAFSVESGFGDDPQTIGAARAAVGALAQETGWTLVNEQPDFEAAPAETSEGVLYVTWWIGEA